MTELREQMIMEIELRGYSPSTMKNYLQMVSNFAKYFNKSPDLLGDDEIRQYLHYCITEKHLCEATVDNIYSALRFLYAKVLKRVWDEEKIPRIKPVKKLPVVLSQSEVKSILGVTTNLKHKAILMTVYGAGLRVSEVVKLIPSDIDSKNMQIRIRRGKGKKDRYSLLSETNLKILRQYWTKYQPKDFLFPGQVPGKSVTTRTAERIFDKALKKAGIKKEASIHTLRHCFATHLLEADTDLFSIQKLMGHNSIQTTTKYLHIRRMDLLKIKSPLEILMENEDEKI